MENGRGLTNMLNYEDLEKLIEVINTQQSLITQSSSIMELQLRELDVMRTSEEWTEDNEKVFILAKDTLKLKTIELKTYSRLLGKLYDLQEKLMDTKGQLTIDDILGKLT